MKLWKKVLIAGISTVFLDIGIFMILIVLILKQSWLFFWIPFIFSAGIWAVVGIILAVNYFQKKQPKYEEISLEDSKKFAIHKIKNDEENPDNFHILDEVTFKIGEKGSELTPIRIYDGDGTECLQRRVFLINMKNREEWDSLIEPGIERLKECIIKLADVQPTVEVKEIISSGVDQWGYPQTKVRVTRPTQAQVKEQEAKEEAEVTSAY